MAGGKVVLFRRNKSTGKMRRVDGVVTTAPKGLTKGQKKAVKNIVNAKAETKMVTFFEGPVGQPSPLQNSTGLFADKALVAHNQFINNNTTDILKVIPDVIQGPGDNQRDGRTINPVSGQLKIRVMIAAQQPALSGWANSYYYDLTAVCFLLQSVTYKTYRALYANNDFSKMLQVGDTTTTSFDGTYQTANLPVDKGYYRVLATKKVYLRSSGANGPVPPQIISTNVTNNNSHKLVHEWTWNYGKHLPKKLLYPDESVTPVNGLNEPLNSSIFWCIGYYNTDGTVQADPVPAIRITEEYTSIMKYKDF